MHLVHLMHWCSLPGPLHSCLALLQSKAGAKIFLRKFNNSLNFAKSKNVSFLPHFCLTNFPPFRLLCTHKNKPRAQLCIIFRLARHAEPLQHLNFAVRRDGRCLSFIPIQFSSRHRLIKRPQCVRGLLPRRNEPLKPAPPPGLVWVQFLQCGSFPLLATNSNCCAFFAPAAAGEILHNFNGAHWHSKIITFVKGRRLYKKK